MGTDSALFQEGLCGGRALETQSAERAVTSWRSQETAILLGESECPCMLHADSYLTAGYLDSSITQRSAFRTFPPASRGGRWPGDQICC